MKYFSFLFLLIVNYCYAQSIDSTYAVKLGYPRDAKVLILHVDDAGMSFDSNEGTIKAMTKGVATSCSVMMPCPWVSGFVHYLQEHKDVDAGLHLTLTSEWKDYRWVPLAGKAAVPGLTDLEGNLWGSVADVVKNGSADEVEKEIRAQIDRAVTIGFHPTHLDSHMGTLFATPAFLERYVKVGIEKNIPVMLPGGHNTLIRRELKAPDAQVQQLQQIGKLLWSSGLPVLDDLHNESYDWKISDNISNDDKKIQAFSTQKYIAAIKSLKPGVTMMIMHCTAPTVVFPYISNSGSVRKGDLLAMTDPLFKAALKKEGIILTTWRELKERRDKLK
jgi:hypothetical protein